MALRLSEPRKKTLGSLTFHYTPMRHPRDERYIYQAMNGFFYGKCIGKYTRFMDAMGTGWLNEESLFHGL